jgi:hypothetical protein
LDLLRLVWLHLLEAQPQGIWPGSLGASRLLFLFQKIRFHCIDGETN